MPLSPGSTVLLNIALLEAMLTTCKKIEPEHLFLAMCKVADLPEDALAHIVKGTPKPLGEVREEIQGIRTLLAAGEVDPTQTRRRLRRLIGKSRSFQGTFTKHRSQRCREVCQAAESRAMVMGNNVASPLHLGWALLSSDAPMIRESTGADDQRWARMLEACGDSSPAPTQATSGGHREVDVDGYVPTMPDDPVRTIADPPCPRSPDLYGEESPTEVVPKRSHTPFLDKFGRDLTDLARQGLLGACVGRKDEMRTLAQILQRKTKNNPVLVGDAGVGKTCIVEGLAIRCTAPGAPETVRDWRIVEVSMGNLIAGAMYQGVLEERLQTVIKEAESDPDLILFMDEIHTLIGAGGGHGKGMDAAQILKPAMARGQIRLIGATTTPEYRKYIESDAALERRLQMVWVNEPTRDETIKILDGIRAQLEAHHNVDIGRDAIEKAVEWSMRYLPDHRLPDKALDILDQACAAQIMRTLSPPDDLGEVTVDLAGGPVEHITEEDIARAISARCQVPVGTIASNEAERLLHMESALKRRVMGQDEAIAQVADAIRIARAGLRKPNRPQGVFLFLGPTGTGKTELAKALAEFLFDTEESLLRIDMSEYREKHNVARLIGAPPGYVGHEDEGQLTGKIRTRPYSVVLFDEIEKAHSDVFDIFLQIFDEGRLTDAKGRCAMFTESIIIMTSNIGTAGSAKVGRGQIGFRPASKDDSSEVAGKQDNDMRAERIHEELSKTFRPEFLNRIDRHVVFEPISQDTISGILDKLIAQLNYQIRDKDVAIAVSDEARALLLVEGYSDTYGARELEGVFEKRVSTPRGQLMLSGVCPPGRIIHLCARDGALKLISD